MSYNKMILFIAVTILAAGLFGYILKSRSNADVEQQVVDEVSLLKQGDGSSHDCEVFEKLVVLSPNSKSATVQVGTMYARGMCQPFDLQKSLDWYRKAGLSEQEIGQALFEAAVWESPADNQVMSLLQKAKEFGYKPAPNELERLSQSQAAIFQ